MDQTLDELPSTVNAKLDQNNGGKGSSGAWQSG